MRILLVLTAVAMAMTAALAAPAFEETRHVYERGEKCVLRLALDGAARVEFDADGWLPQAVDSPVGVAEYAIDTALLSVADYVVRARVMPSAGEPVTCTYALTVAPKHDGERMPVWRWGGGENQEWWKERGFTGGFFMAPPDPPADAAATKRYAGYLEEATRLDLELGLYFRTLDSEKLKADQSARTVRPDGTIGEEPYPLAPAAVEHTKASTDAWMAALKGYPAMRHVMLNSEWQQAFCVNETAVAMAREEAGLDLKQFLTEKGWVVGPSPEDVQGGILADDNPRYRFLQWWWQRGHGMAPMNEIQHEIIKRHRPDAITWHEPYRLAPVRNAAKGLDSIATWTYGFPDIKRLCYTTYLQAAARPEGQLVQQDITLFVYAYFVLKLDGSTANFANDFPGSDPYFTAGPDYAREAMWLVVSQRPDILCFYSAGKLSPDNPTLDPHFSSPETFDAIGQTCDELVKPFGPAIRYCKRYTPRTALLMSAAATWFPSSPGLAGYPTEQTLPYATLLMMNHVPFEVLLDEDIAEGALDRYDVLVLPKADSLLKSVHERICAFAARGGTVIADQSLRAEVPGANMTAFDFTHQVRIDGKSLAKGEAVTAEEDRAIMESYAGELAPLLSASSRPIDATSPRVLVNTLDGGHVRYHFLINDERTYGPRFGETKLQFELGVPQTADVSVALEGRPALYDVLRREPVEYTEADGRARFSVRLPAARGKLIAALPEPVGSVSVEAPAEVAAGTEAKASIRVLGESGKPFEGVHPLRVELIDPSGRDSEWSRYSATREGLCEFAFIPAVNDLPGAWKVRVTDLVAGKTGEASIVFGG